ncbi:hypothetical protein BCR37DRAFT_381670 [Protomyces lactucae-debilis]|uniref:Uncharacterized protein n=1 Tax=Protomyces lactucae-debilis TaxID=2754530 RepID=A0A1Y2F7Z1_PROLT|nr:uncharacterized protein BCR37DRAFT_381670 [Protomyces lactucae-debilis]ORY79486.1 hypothetical protein BCR37DRAFT_381670 [Protomyces lactucae-debilis]
MDTVLSNAGAISKVILDGTSFAADADISGMVEVTVPRGKEISSVQLELCSWRHIALKRTTAGAGKAQGEKSHVEQLTRQTLELFPNLDIGGAGRNGHDTKTLKDTAIFTFRFVALQPTKAPTTEAFATGRIKHYMTCFVHKRAGLLNREKLMEKNQFQIPITAPVLEVDALFPDRTFTSLEARPNAANVQDYAFRVRCNTHLLSGLPFLVECDIANHATARSITLSLHQRAFASIGKIEEEQFYRSLYVHEAARPEPARDGHFRGKSSPRPLAYGQKVYLVEWTCPRRDSRTRLPFKETLYAKTAEANLECGLSLRVEMDLENGDRLVSVVHGITYVPDWIDARSDRQSTSLRQERSIMQDSQSPASSLMTTGRRLSTASSQSDLKTSPGFAPPGFSSFRRPQQASSHLRHASHASSLVPGIGTGESYFERQRSQLASSRGGLSPRTPNEFDPVLTHGTYAPPRAGAVRTIATQQPQLFGSVGAQTQDPGIVSGRQSVSRDTRPDQITLPPASVRSSMSMAFEHMNLAGSGPVSANASSQGARSPLIGQEGVAASIHSIRSLPPGTPPPPSQPLPPPPPPTSGGSQRSAFTGLGLLSGSSRPVSIHQPAAPPFVMSQANGRSGGSPAASVASLVSPVAGGLDDRPASRLGGRSSRAIRPAVVLGISQSTIQTMQSRDDGGVSGSGSGSGMAAPTAVESPVVPLSSMLSHGSANGAVAGPEYHTGSVTGSPSIHGGSFDVATRVTSTALDGHAAPAPANASLSSRAGSAGLSPPSRSRTPSSVPAAGTTAGLVQGLFNMSGGGKRASETPDAVSLRDSGYAGSTVAMQRGTPPTQRSVPQPQSELEQHQAGNEILLG